MGVNSESEQLSLENLTLEGEICAEVEKHNDHANLLQ